MFWKRTLPITIAFITGLLGMVLYYSPHPVADKALNTLNTWIRVVSAFALFIGIVSLIHIHGNKIKRRVEGWGYSIFVFLGFIITFGLSLYNQGSWFLAARVESTDAMTTQVDWIYNSIQNPAQSAMFAMLAFFVASSAFRTFRAKTVEAAILLLAALVVMFGKTPIAAMVSDQIPSFAAWLLAVPNMAVKRALLFGVCLGMVATSLRVIFGIERSYLGGE